MFEEAKEVSDRPYFLANFAGVRFSGFEKR